MKETITVVKVGGAVVEDGSQLYNLLSAFKDIKGRKVLVHGGGRSATVIASKLGIESKMVNGRRITDQDMLEVVTMVYGGLVNKNVVAKLQSLGVNALGLTGADMNVMLSHKRPLKDGVDFGFVGDVDRADSDILHNIIDITGNMLLLQFVISSLCSGFYTCRKIYLNLCIWQHAGSDISTIHNNVCLCRQILL